jgi:hypothetical protein
MRTSSNLLVLLACMAVAGLAGCDRHEPLLICHNSNCGSPDTTRDDTLDALQESLALRHDGLPVLDGMEIDTFWYGAESTCLFAHDLVHDTSTPATAAADAIAAYLAAGGRASWNGDRFYMLFDLKPHVGPDYSDKHTPEQLVDHAQCVLSLAETILVGARTGGHQITFGFISAVPRHLEVLRAQPQWTTLQAQPDAEMFVIGDIFAPYSSVVPELSEFEHLDIVEYHPDFMTVPQRETYRSLGIDLMQWSFVTTTEALGAIDYWEPKYAITNEAALVRRWAEN